MSNKPDAIEVLEQQEEKKRYRGQQGVQVQKACGSAPRQMPHLLESFGPLSHRHFLDAKRLAWRRTRSLRVCKSGAASAGRA